MEEKVVEWVVEGLEVYLQICVVYVLFDLSYQRV